MGKKHYDVSALNCRSERRDFISNICAYSVKQAEYFFCVKQGSFAYRDFRVMEVPDPDAPVQLSLF